MAMQLCRLDAKFIVISLEDENQYKNQFGFVNNNEKLKVLAMMSRGYFLDYKDIERYSKYEDESNAKIERTNKKNRLTPLQKMLFCRPIYYDSIFSGGSSITDYRPLLAQKKNPDKNKNVSKHFDSLNPVKLMAAVFAPVYRKVLYTEYTLEANFKNI